jgi:hypothetical protein
MRLSAREVREIYALLADNDLSHQQIAEDFGVSRVTVSYINSGRTWSDLRPKDWKPSPPIRTVGERAGNVKLSEEEVREIYRLAWAGHHTLRELGARFGVSLSQISLIKHRKEWKHLLLDDGKDNSMPDNNDDLKAEIDQLKKRQTELEAKLAEAGKPPAPFKSEPRQPIDYTAGASMDRETTRDLASAIPPDLARDLHNDLARGNPITASQSQLPQERGGGGVQIQRGDGWAKERKIEPPPGVPIMDRLMDMQDAIDKADLQRRLAGAKAKE